MSYQSASILSNPNTSQGELVGKVPVKTPRRKERRVEKKRVRTAPAGGWGSNPGSTAC